MMDGELRNSVQNEEIILFQVRLSSDGVLTLNQTDQDLCIRRNGCLVSGCYWRKCELEKAIGEFRAIVHRLGSAPVQWHPRHHSLIDA